MGHHHRFTSILLITGLFLLLGCSGKKNGNEIIHVRSVSKLEQVRTKAIRYIFKQNQLPLERGPDEIRECIVDERYKDMKNLDHIDMLTIRMKHGFESIVYLLHPKDLSRNKLMIFHQGHEHGFTRDLHFIERFIEKGFTVLALAMPLGGMNSRPVIDIPSFGNFQMMHHSQFSLLETREFSPLSLFLEPVTVSLNYALGKKEYREVSMVGVSGGGWTTDVYAALDDRINNSYPVAGGYPLFLRTTGPDWGDYEQTHVGLLKIANYLDLYVMGSYGEGRKRVQILNLYDSCCFWGDRFKYYENDIKEIVKSLGEGSFNIFVDKSHKDHMMSGLALDTILKEEGVDEM